MSLEYARHRNSPLHTRMASGRMASDASRLRVALIRTHPYHKLDRVAPTASAPSRNPDELWPHDLFDDDSNLYSPKPRWPGPPPPQDFFQGAEPPPKPSPSLRPFGPQIPTSAPAPKRLAPPSNLNPTAPSFEPAPQITHQTSVQLASTNGKSSFGMSLLSRIQSGPLKVSSQPTEMTVPVLPYKPQNTAANSHNVLSPSDLKVATAKQRNLAARAYDDAMASYLSGPVVLEVANLADGTSAEDVKTAFADFGDIQECSTEEGPRQGTQPTLKARMVFTNKFEADRAVDALNGALADGLTLAVKVVGRAGKKPTRADFESAVPSAPAQSRPAAKSAVLMAQPPPDVTMAGPSGDSLPVVVPTGRLRSEVVAQCDPRASLQLEPQLIPVLQVSDSTHDILNRVLPSSAQSNRRQLPSHLPSRPQTLNPVSHKPQLSNRPPRPGRLSLLSRIHRE